MFPKEAFIRVKPKIDHIEVFNYQSHMHIRRYVKKNFNLDLSIRP